MKQALLLLTCLFSVCGYSQDIAEKTGQIEVRLIPHTFKLNKNDEPTNRITNRKKRPQEVLYLDSAGVLLKKIRFGKHHNASLKILDNITLYTCTNGVVDGYVEYESDYNKKIYPHWKTRYTYNDKGQLTDDSEYYYDNDSLFMKSTYEYDENSNPVKTIHVPNLVYNKTFDAINRLISFQQIYKDSLQWEWKYSYEPNQRTGLFTTYYSDGKNYTKKEVITYDGDGNIVEQEERYTSGLTVGKKSTYSYDKGLISKIEFYAYYNDDCIYKKTSFTDVKIKTSLKLDEDVCKKVNEYATQN